jgi:hypothetical protein
VPLTLRGFLCVCVPIGLAVPVRFKVQYLPNLDTDAEVWWSVWCEGAISELSSTTSATSPMIAVELSRCDQYTRVWVKGILHGDDSRILQMDRSSHLFTSPMIMIVDLPRNRPLVSAKAPCAADFSPNRLMANPKHLNKSKRHDACPYHPLRTFSYLTGWPHDSHLIKRRLIAP